jgi:thiamine biosynthesis protein ThiS
VIRVAHKNIDWHAGMTITDLLQEIDDPHPYAVVRINDTYVSRPNFDKTTIPDDSQIFLIPTVAGG